MTTDELIDWLENRLAGYKLCAASTPEDTEDEMRQSFYRGMVSATEEIIKKIKDDIACSS